jgi:prepilin-type N-terminal cleavage/methylation domain-containing protein
MRRQTGQRPGFSLVELLIVVVIVLVLIGLLVPTIHLLRRSQYRTVTVKTMEELTRAITMYLDDYASLGFTADARDFVAEPLTFLHRRPLDAGLTAYFDPGQAQRIRVTDPAAARVRPIATPAPGGAATVVTDGRAEATPREATHLIDGFGGNLLLWRVLNGQVGNRVFPRVIEIRSEAGTGNTSADDLIYISVVGDDPIAFDGLTYPGTEGDWRLVRQQDLD